MPRTTVVETEIEHNVKPDQITPYSIENAWGRYDQKGESAMYLSETLPGNKTEMTFYGDWNAYSTYQFNNVDLLILDLTDKNIQKYLGIDFNQLTLTMSKTRNPDIDNPINYEFTNKLVTWARQRGYKGLKVPGARGAKDYNNYILFYQTDVNNAFSNQIPTKIIK